MKNLAPRLKKNKHHYTSSSIIFLLYRLWTTGEQKLELTQEKQ